MLGANSSSQHYISINKNSNETGKSNFIQNNQNIIGNNNISNELYLLYQTPIKQIEQMDKNNNEDSGETEEELDEEEEREEGDNNDAKNEMNNENKINENENFIFSLKFNTET